MNRNKRLVEKLYYFRSGRAKHTGGLLCFLIVCYVFAQISIVSGYAEQGAEKELQQSEMEETMYREATDLLYMREFQKAKAIFLNLGEYGDSADKACLCDDYLSNEPDFGEALIQEKYVSRTYPHGKMYSVVRYGMDRYDYRKYMGYLYVPEIINPQTTFLLYFCGGIGEDYLYYNGLNPYFDRYYPNSVMLFVNTSGYGEMEYRIPVEYELLQKIAYECGTILHDVSTIGSSNGCYTAIKAAAWFFRDYGLPVRNCVTLDTGVEWYDFGNVDCRESCYLAEAGTVMYHFEQPGVGLNKAAIRRMVAHGVETWIMECTNDNHNTISVLAYTYGLFSFCAGDDCIVLPAEEYRPVQLSRDEAQVYHDCTISVDAEDRNYEADIPCEQLWIETNGAWMIPDADENGAEKEVTSQ